MRESSTQVLFPGNVANICDDELLNSALRSRSGAEKHQSARGRIKSSQASIINSIIEKLRAGLNDEDILLLITPSQKHCNQYKFHVIDRALNVHLGMTSITRNELMRWQSTKVFHDYNVAFGSKYVDLSSIALQSSVIDNINNTLNGDCSCPHGTKIMIDKATSMRTINDRNNPTTHQGTQVPSVVCPDSHKSNVSTNSSKYSLKIILHKATGTADLNRPKSAAKSAVDQCPRKHNSISELINCINSRLRPAENDLNQFFEMAIYYGLKIYARPELCWRNPDIELDTTIVAPNRFILECFMLFDNYVGSITLELDVLLGMLTKYDVVSSKMCVINDVLHLTPIPNCVVTLLRKLFLFFGLELLYDAFAESLFEFFMNFR